MATIFKRGDFWRAQVRKRGYPSIARTFDREAQAKEWARGVESAMYRGSYVDATEAERTTLDAALARYERDVTPRKRSAVSEKARIKAWRNHPLALRSLASIRGADLSRHKDLRRSAGRADNTIRLELALIGHLYETARREWGMEGLINPTKNMRMPTGSAARERRIEGDEYARALDLLGRFEQGPLLCASFVLAIETALRRSMLVQLRWEHVDLDRRIIKIPPALRAVENKGVPIAIPIWDEAFEVLKRIPRPADGRILPYTTNALWCAWKHVQRHEDAGSLRTLRWHDLRHEATSRLFEKGLNTMEVQAVTGHKSMQMLKRYSHLRAEDLLRKYAKPPVSV